MPMTTQEWITTLLETKGEGATLPSSQKGFNLAQGYEVAHGLHGAQNKQGKTLVGRKIGISNRAAWDALGLSDVVWGYVFEDTVIWADNNEHTLSLEGLPQPKLEPEIVFGLKDVLPTDTRDPAELLKSVAWMALGFEVVQCPYPDWKFKPADLVATFGFHGALVIGDKMSLEGKKLSKLAASLAETKATLYKGDEVVAEGGGTNVVDSPAVALGHIADLIAKDRGAEPLGENELITTGTLTAAPSLTVGETYRVSVTGLDLPELTLSLG